MIKIQELSDQIEDELRDAEKYIDCAIKEKNEFPDVAATHAKLSSEEMAHMAALHEQVVALIEKYRKEHGDPPEKMMWRYEYLHEKHQEKANEIRVKQLLFKG